MSKQLNLLSEEQGTPLFSQPEVIDISQHPMAQMKGKIHLTLTGYHAGYPLCGINKREASMHGHTFQHAMYFKAWEDNRLCPNCKAEWDAAADEPSDPMFT